MQKLVPSEGMSEGLSSDDGGGVYLSAVAPRTEDKVVLGSVILFSPELIQ